MSEDQNGEKKYRVEDRRTSSGAAGKEEKPAEPAGSPDPTSEPQGETHRQEDPADALKVDFSTFIFSLFSSALIQLGDMADPLTGTVEPNLQAAKQTIDIIDMMREKTAGNLTDEEGKLLENASAELKWKYLDAVKKKD
jgi:hypothetical protein